MYRFISAVFFLSVSITSAHANAPVCLLESDLDGDGWGWEYGESCKIPGGPTDAVGGCDYSNAAANGGWGWNAAAQESCAPVSSVTVVQQQHSPAHDECHAAIALSEPTVEYSMNCNLSGYRNMEAHSYNLTLYSDGLADLHRIGSQIVDDTLFRDLPWRKLANLQFVVPVTSTRYGNIIDDVAMRLIPNGAAVIVGSVTDDPHESEVHRCTLN